MSIHSAATSVTRFFERAFYFIAAIDLVGWTLNLYGLWPDMINWYSNSPNGWITLSIVFPLAIGAFLHFTLKRFENIPETFDWSARDVADYVCKKCDVTIEVATDLIMELAIRGKIHYFAKERGPKSSYRMLPTEDLLYHSLDLIISKNDVEASKITCCFYDEDGWIIVTKPRDDVYAESKTIYVAPRFQSSRIRAEIKFYRKSVPKSKQGNHVTR